MTSHSQWVGLLLCLLGGRFSMWVAAHGHPGISRQPWRSLARVCCFQFGFSCFLSHGENTAAPLPRVKSLGSLGTLSWHSENPETIRSSSIADPLRDYIIMRRHCALGSVHTVAAGCKRVAHEWTAVSCMSSQEALLSTLMTAWWFAKAQTLWLRMWFRHLCLPKRFSSDFGACAVRWTHVTSVTWTRARFLVKRSR